MSNDIDMDEILDLFLEESFEGLDVMEQGLLALDIGQVDLETINNIFRAAHSIKGGAGTLGYMEVAHFTHGVETLLDEIRAGKRVTTPENVQVLLKSVDHLRGLMTSMKNKEALDLAAGSAIEAEILAMLGQAETGSSAVDVVIPTGVSEPTETVPTVDNSQPAMSDSVPAGWHIVFVPKQQFFSRGNDPLLILRDLKKLGDLSLKAKTNRVPIGDLFDPERCYLSWDMHLRGDATQAQIEELFEWVVDDCDLKIDREGGSAPTSTSVASDGVIPAEAAIVVTTHPVPVSAPSVTPPEVNTSGAVQIPPATGPDRKSATVTPAKAAATGGNVRESASIRVSTDKIDTLLNLVGELVITQSMLRRFGNFDGDINVNDLRDGLIQLERHTRELQESVMQIRMLPISFCFSRFPRLVHDLSAKLGKKIDLQIVGQQTELDKTVLEKIGDPLVHLVRNSLDHGIESTETRIAAGKPETGVITLSASHQGGNVVIQVKDDGAGINKEKVLAKARAKGIVGPEEVLSDERIFQLIFAPGFSTADVISDVSGRGVGMDVVRRNIHDLGGRVEIASEVGKGSTFTIRLPLTLAILDGQLIRVAGTTFVISLLSILESIQVRPEQINEVPGQGRFFSMRDDYIPVVSLAEQFGMRDERNGRSSDLLVVLEAGGTRFGVFVDELLDQQQVVIKSLEDNYRQIEGLSGATILGDGSVALIIDAQGLAPKVSTESRPASRAA